MWPFQIRQGQGQNYLYSTFKNNQKLTKVFNKLKIIKTQRHNNRTNKQYVEFSHRVGLKILNKKRKKQSVVKIITIQQFLWIIHSQQTLRHPTGKINDF